MCTAAAKSTGHLVAIRLLQGIAESSTFVGAHYVMGAWYKVRAPHKSNFKQIPDSVRLFDRSMRLENEGPSSPPPLKSPRSSRECFKVRQARCEGC